MSLMRLCAAVWLALASVCLAGESWPTYRGNIQRTAATANRLDPQLALDWVYQAPDAPTPGWAGEQGRTVEGKVLMHRVTFDDALHVALADGRVYFGSPVDHQLHCRDAATGKSLWTFFTGGPIRLAPAIVDGRVYFGSDDGHAYCLDAKTGRLIWQVRGGPVDDWFLARGYMTARWPIRTGVLVENNIAYFGAGIFPHEDVMLYAVHADTGKVIWRRDEMSQLDAGRNDLSPQGYLLASDEMLIVPSGRSLPAAVDRATGQVVHKRTHGWRSSAGGVVGGSEAMLADGQIYSFGAHHILAMDQKDGDVGFGWFEGRQMAIVADAAFLATGQHVMRLDRIAYAEASRQRQALESIIYSASRKLRGKPKNSDQLREEIAEARKRLAAIPKDIGVAWRVDDSSTSSLIVAGNLVLVGGPGEVKAYAAADGRQLWSAKVEGDARGLAAADGRLFVSTTEGHVYSFAPGKRRAQVLPHAQTDQPYPPDQLTAIYESAAQQILDQSGVRRGFALVVGAERGRLAFELAKRSDLQIYCVESDPQKVAEARQALDRAGYYGHRVVVHHADLSAMPYSNFFANLIVSDTLVLESRLPQADPQQVARHLKPLGGVICLGRPGSPAQPALASWLQATELGDQAQIETREAWAILRRGALPGAGKWTHQYGEPGNTAASDERRVRGGLGVLWFGDPGPNKMVNRHEGAVGPLAINGRLIVQGVDSVMAYDSYNGLFLWELPNPEAIRTGVFKNENPGNMAATDDAVFMFAGPSCVEIDAATGDLRRIHTLPADLKASDYQWGYIAIDQGLLFGTATIRKELAESARRRGRVTEDATDTIFAIDLATASHVWSYKGKSISHHTVAVGGGRVFFIDSSLTSEQRAALVNQDKSKLENLTPAQAKAEEERLKTIDVRMAVALDAASGRKIWAQPVDVADCSEVGIGGGKLTMMYHRNVLLLCGANYNGHFWSQFVKGDFSRRRLVALDANDGALMWARDANYLHRPAILGDRVLAEPWAYDITTGQQQMRCNALTGELEPWSMQRTGHHCGPMVASQNMLFFRSGFTGFYDILDDVGPQHFAGHRLGCWINAIPANGLVMIPEAGAGCVCLFSIESTIVMEPREARRPWSIYSSVGPTAPVRHMALNLGAPGDRRDENGTLWLTYPRPMPYKKTSLEMNLPVDPKLAEGGSYISVNERSAPVHNAQTPWLFTSWAQGLTACNLTLRRPEDGPARYHVTLYLADMENDAPGQRLFDIKLQGRTVLKNLDLTARAGGRAHALIHRIENVEVAQTLTIELVPRTGLDQPARMPLLNAVEVTIEDSPPQPAAE